MMSTVMTWTVGAYCRQAFGELPQDVARFADGAAAQGGMFFNTLSDFATQVPSGLQACIQG